jgi:hypothetical protein
MISGPAIRFGTMFVDDEIAVLFWLAGFKQAWSVKGRSDAPAVVDPVELLIGHDGPDWPLVLYACQESKPNCLVIVCDGENDDVLESLHLEGYRCFDWPFLNGKHWIIGHVEDTAPMANPARVPSDNDSDIQAWLAKRIHEWFHAGEDAPALRLQMRTMHGDS